MILKENMRNREAKMILTALEIKNQIEKIIQLF